MSNFLLISKMTTEGIDQQPVLDLAGVTLSNVGPLGASYDKNDSNGMMDEFGLCLKGLTIPALEETPTETSFFDLEVTGSFFLEMIPLPFVPNSEATWMLKDKNYMYKASNLTKAFASGTDNITIVDLGAGKIRVINNTNVRSVLRMYIVGNDEINNILPANPLGTNIDQFVPDNDTSLGQTAMSVSIYLAAKPEDDFTNAMSYAGVIEMGNLTPGLDSPVVMKVGARDYQLVDSSERMKEILDGSDIEMIELTEWKPGDGGEVDLVYPEGKFDQIYLNSGWRPAVGGTATANNSTYALISPTGVRTEHTLSEAGEFDNKFTFEEGYWTVLGNVDWLLTPVYGYVTNDSEDAPMPTNLTITPGGKGSIIKVTIGANAVAMLIPSDKDDEPTAYAMPDENGVATFDVPYTTGFTGIIRNSRGDMGTPGIAVNI